MFHFSWETKSYTEEEEHTEEAVKRCWTNRNIKNKVLNQYVGEKLDSDSEAVKLLKGNKSWSRGRCHSEGLCKLHQNPKSKSKKKKGQYVKAPVRF